MPLAMFSSLGEPPLPPTVGVRIHVEKICPIINNDIIELAKVKSCVLAVMDDVVRDVVDVVVLDHCAHFDH